MYGLKCTDSNVPESNCFGYLPQYGGQLVARPFFLVFGFRFSSPERRRVAEAGQGILTNMFEHVAA